MVVEYTPQNPSLILKAVTQRSQYPLIKDYTLNYRGPNIVI